MRLTAVCITLCLASNSHAAEQEELTESHKVFITEAVNLLGDCSGFFEFISDSFKATSQPATAQQMHEMANGAMMAAAYLLSVEYAAKHDKAKKIGDFVHYPQGRADTNKTRLLALLEQNDQQALEQEQKRCIDAVSLQKDLVQKMRDQSVAR